MSGKFDAYEYVGVIAPGSIAIFAVALLYPELKGLVVGTEVSLGGLGLFLIMSYVAGHLVQAVGNCIEAILWFALKGMPTTWVLSEKQTLIAPPQREALLEAIKRRYPEFHAGSKSASKEWQAITREIYVRVRKADQAQRIDAFNRTYGMLRGIAAGFILVAILLAVRGTADMDFLLVLVALFFLSLIRMYHFGVLYGRELLVTYVSVDGESS